MTWYLDALAKYAVCNGRAARTEFWSFVLVHIAVMFFVAGIDRRSLGRNEAVLGLGLLYGLFVFIPSIAVAVRRLHDSGKSGWWLFLAPVPLGGLIPLIFMLLPSSPGTNEYGSAP